MSNRPPMSPRARWGWRVATVLIAAYSLVVVSLWWWWDHEPERFDVVAVARDHAARHGHAVVTGTVTTATVVEVADRMLHKRGGYLANDIAPPGLWMDNVPSWEYGVVLQLRDVAQALRNEFSRSQSQSVEDDDLREAFNFFSYKHQRWILPSTESQYRTAIARTEAYLGRLGDADENNAQFYARADNLADYLALVSSRLGSLSQRLSARRPR